MQNQSGSSIPVFNVLQNKAFINVWCAGSLHEISRRTELLVLSLLIFQTTGSPFQLLLVLVFNNVPRPILSLIFGSIADRFNRWHVMLLAQFANVITSGVVLGLIFYDVVQPWQLYLALIMQGITKALEDPSRRTAILDIVGETKVVNALSLDQIGNTTGKIAGPFLAGLLVETMGFSEAYSFVLITHILAFGFVMRIKIPERVIIRNQQQVARGLWLSIKYALANPLLMGMLYITIIMNAVAFPAQQLITAIGDTNLNVGETLIGVLVAAEGVGQLIGAGLMAASRNIQYHGRVFSIGSTIVLIMGLMWAWSPWYVLTFCILILGGIGQSGFGTMQSSITMLSAPQELRGRMVGLMSFCIGVGTPIGGLEMGLLAAALGSQWAISVNAVVGLALILPAMIITPLITGKTVEQRNPVPVRK